MEIDIEFGWLLLIEGDNSEQFGVNFFIIVRLIINSCGCVS